MSRRVNVFKHVQPGTKDAPKQVRYPDGADFVEVLDDAGRPFRMHLHEGAVVVAQRGDFVPLDCNAQSVGVADITSSDAVELDETLPTTSRVELLFMDHETAQVRASSSSSRPVTHTKVTRYQVVFGADRSVTRPAGVRKATIKNVGADTVRLSHVDASGTDYFDLPVGASVEWYGPIHAYHATANQDLELIAEVFEK